MTRGQRFHHTIKALGLADRLGDLSFNKAITLAFLVQCAFIAIVWASVVLYVLLHDRAMLAMAARIFPPWHFLSFEGLVLMSGFGLKGIAIWADAKTMMGTSHDATQLNATVDLNKLAHDEAGD
jgi:hypothetical protein